MNPFSHNARAWDRLVEAGNEWTRPADPAVIERARVGELELLLIPDKPVPMEWYPPLAGTPTLCLASGGGQQGPPLAAAGAVVTVLDASPKQLGQDRAVAERDGLELTTSQGDMADLSAFADESFGLVFHPCANCFAESVRPVWRECWRVLRPGGVLLAGFCNPVRFAVEDGRYDNGSLLLRFPVPTSDAADLTDPKIKAQIDAGDVLEFGHTLTDQIGGQLDAGFLLTAMMESRFQDPEGDPVSRLMDTFIATRAVKPGGGN
ncbi:Methyltransferase domain protein [Pseudobythopirellula maris]|uniref:Methyltransferase domain protein n=1 Tax=Pseudobythopirellula maris TaxID=2527991 RepID=A0A5C5ZV60_9BACT|nr:class I SAM-dependent methyltransferase [Pseudobythopirellula maris]TWT90938.1 Methyltransferase domain protein [Pseudobythopirellula maris]